MRVLIIGGGAAGFFLAIRLKELCPDIHVDIVEKNKRVLAKVEISGGGRCNCTNTFDGVSDLRQVYPRGATLLKRLFCSFGPQQAYQWFESHGVPLVIQDDGCVFPKVQDSHAIIDCFMQLCHTHGVRIMTMTDGFTLDPTTYDAIAITTGGIHKTMRSRLEEWGVTLTPTHPSLFTFTIEDKALRDLMGVVSPDVQCSLAGTRFRSSGALLITHWGMSGPAILKLSSHAAVLLAEQGYRAVMNVNWCPQHSVDEITDMLHTLIAASPSKLADNLPLPGLQSRLSRYLMSKAGISGRRLSEIGKRHLNRLVEVLTHDAYTISGKSPFRNEFVTCGGVDLASIDKRTLEYVRPLPGLAQICASTHSLQPTSAHASIPKVYFAGEALDIDGVTGGFNFQAAWSTADAVARAIATSHLES